MLDTAVYNNLSCS